MFHVLLLKITAYYIVVVFFYSNIFVIVFPKRARTLVKGDYNIHSNTRTNFPLIAVILHLE